MEDSLNAKQRRCVIELLATGSIEQAAAKVEISERSIRDWLKKPEFKAALAEAEADLLAATVRRLTRVQDKAVATLETELSSDAANVRIRAAVALLDFALRFRQVEQYEQRISALEARLGH